MNKYHLALGRFIETFAVAELWAMRVLWAAARVDETTGRAAFSGTRARGAIDAVRRIFVARDAVVPDELGRAFEHMNDINSMRDNVVHWHIGLQGSALFDAQLVVTNEFITHSRQKEKAFAISHTLLDQMTADLETIRIVLRHYVISQWEDSPTRTELLAQHVPPAHAQWQYKPVQPLSTTARSRESSQVHLGTPKPSQA